jgi:hypothetical protein
MKNDTKISPTDKYKKIGREIFKLLDLYEGAKREVMIRMGYKSIETVRCVLHEGIRTEETTMPVIQMALEVIKEKEAAILANKQAVKALINQLV